MWTHVQELENIQHWQRTASMSNLRNSPCRIWHENNLLIGYVRTRDLKGFYVHEGRIVNTLGADFEKLDADFIKNNALMKWVPHEEGRRLPENALVAGATFDSEIYFGRSISDSNNFYYYGQVLEYGKCQIATDDQGVVEKVTFEILTCDVVNEF